VDRHGPPRLIGSPAKTSVKGRGKKPVVTDSPGGDSIQEVSSSISTPVPEPRITRSVVRKPPSKAQQLSPEPIELSSGSEDETDSPNAESHFAGRRTRKRRARFTDSADEDTPILRKRRRPSSKAVKTSVYVSTSSEEEESFEVKKGGDNDSSGTSPDRNLRTSITLTV